MENWKAKRNMQVQRHSLDLMTAVVLFKICGRSCSVTIVFNLHSLVQNFRWVITLNSLAVLWSCVLCYISDGHMFLYRNDRINSRLVFWDSTIGILKHVSFIWNCNAVHILMKCDMRILLELQNFFLDGIYF